MAIRPENISSANNIDIREACATGFPPNKWIYPGEEPADPKIVEEDNQAMLEWREKTLELERQAITNLRIALIKK